MGGMIAAEMACLAPREVGKLALVGAAGLWLDEHPIPDIFAMLPYELAEVLFHDPAAGQALLTGGVDFSDMDALQGVLPRHPATPGAWRARSCSRSPIAGCRSGSIA